MTAGEGTDAPPAFAGGAQNAAGPGTYKVKLTIGGKDYFTTITVRADPDKR